MSKEDRYSDREKSEGEIYSDVDSLEEFHNRETGYTNKRKEYDGNHDNVKSTDDRDKKHRSNKSGNIVDDKDYDSGDYNSKSYDKDRGDHRPSRDRSREKDSHKKEYRDSRYYKHDDRRRSRSSERRRRSRSRSRSRRYKHRRHHRRYSSSDSRSSRSRSSSRSYRRRSPSYDSYSSDDSRDYYNDRHERSQEMYKQEPNNTIMVRGLPLHFTEQEIRQDILKCGILAKDIRLIRNRETGASRGFAFVEFHNVQESIRYMDMKRGILVIDEYKMSLIYSVPKSYGEKPRLLNDWTCNNCHAHNFKRRAACFKCNNPRPDEPDPEISELSSHPTNTILLYNLDALTTEEGVLQAFKSRPALARIPIRSVRVAREAVTDASGGKGPQISKGMVYVECNNVTDAVKLYTLLTDDILIIDSRQVGVAYSKPPSYSNSTNVAAIALAAAQWTNSQTSSRSSSQILDEQEIDRLASSAALMYSQANTEQYDQYFKYYQDYYRNQHREGFTSSSSQGASQSSDAVSSSQSQSSTTVGVIMSSSGSDSTGATERKTEPGSMNVPDASQTSQWQYDETTGYYYDPGTQYYYDAHLQQFLYWDAEQSKYVAVSSGSSSQSSELKKNSTENKKKDKEKKIEKQDKVKVAKKIAKDMEKWAKTLNQKKDGSKVPVNVTNISSVSYSPLYVDSSGSAVATVSSSASDSVSTYNYSADSNVKSSMSVTDRTKSSVLAPYGDDSESDDDHHRTGSAITADSLIDFNKLACLLCKRQFPNKDVLIKHTQLSDLHKRNLDALKSSNSTTYKSMPDTSSNYRDRAKERRMLFGSEPTPSKTMLKDLYIKAKSSSMNVTEEPTKEGVKEDNIGNKLLQRMGWKEGTGLGKDNRGRTNIITTERRAAHAGLGLKGAAVIDDDDGDRYSRTRKLTLARYKELDDN